MGILSSIIGIIIIFCSLVAGVLTFPSYQVYQAVWIVSGSIFIVGGIICSQISKATKKILNSLDRGHAQRVMATTTILESLGKKKVQNDTADTTANTIKDIYI